MWKVRLYKKTGLNSANIVDGPGRLVKAEYIDLDALDILQGEGLNFVSVKATRKQVKDADFMLLTNTDDNEMFFYVVNSFNATSVDVMQLSVTLDALTTLEQMVGGIGNIEFLDGIVERRHVSKSEDVYGAFTEDDPLLVPSHPLEIETGFAFGGYGAEYPEVTIIESTVSLDIQADNYQATTYTDAAKELAVTVPTVVAVTEKTEVTLPGLARSYDCPATEYFDYSNEKVQKGVQNLRALGVEGAILNSYTLKNYTGQGDQGNADCSYVPTDSGRIIGIQGIDTTSGVNGIIPKPLNLNFSAQNERIFYGRLNKIVLCSAANGTRVDFNPENVFIDEYGGITENLKVRKITDPRPQGRPYFMPQYYRATPNSYQIFNDLANAVPGMQWANAPLVYTGRSGSTLAQIEYNTVMEEAGSNKFAGDIGNLMSLTSGVAHSLAGMPSSPDLVDESLFSYSGRRGYSLRSEKGIQRHYAAMRQNEAAIGNYKSGLASWGVGAVTGIANAGIEYGYNDWNLQRAYNLTARRELQNLMIGNSVVMPEVNFPNNETMRDFVGNRLDVIQYHPSRDDYEKLDKILTMYGYRITESIDASFFTNRSKFNYVQAHGVTIGGDVPRWLREAAAMQLASGVRVWHQLPDIAAYTDGTNI